MKFGVLRAIGHNLADSIACGNGFMVGLYSMDVYREAAASPESYIQVDFLSGEINGAPLTPGLSDALQLYTREAFPSLCASHGIAPSAFRELKVTFRPSSNFGRFEVTVEDQEGRRAIDEFDGIDAHRVQVPRG